MPTKNQIGDPAMLAALDAAQNQTQNPATAGAAPVAGGDDADEYAQRLNSTASQLDGQVQTLQQSMAYGTKHNPDQYAKLLQLQQRTGVTPLFSKDRQQQLEQKAAYGSVDYPGMVQTQPKTALWLSNPDNAAVAHDDLDNLAQIEQGSAAMREYASFAGNTNAAVFGAVKPFIDAAGVAVEGAGESVNPLTDLITGGDKDFDLEQLKNIWTQPRNWWVQQHVTGPAEDWLTQGVAPGPQEYVKDPKTGTVTRNPAYRWWGRPLVNSIEQVPGALAAFALTGKMAGAAGDTAGAEGSTLDAQAVPAMLGTQAAQQTYAQARAKGADQKAAVLAALYSGMTNYALMGKMPGGVPAETVPGIIGQWAGRSAALGTGMALSDNAIARSYDPDRSLTEGIPQSIASMAAFEGVGAGGDLYHAALGHIADAVDASKLRKRAPQAFEDNLATQFEGQASLRVPAEDFINYFQGKNLDPAAMANQVGVSNLEEAATVGADLEIPAENFFGKLDPEHQKALLPDVVNPSTALTQRQAQTYRDELQQFNENGGLEQLQADYAREDAETQASPAWKEVKEDLKQRYVAAGESETYAESKSTLDANVFSNLARESGMTPQEVLALTNPKIVAGEAPGAEPARYQQAIEKIRSVVEAANQEGDVKKRAVIAPADPWLVDLAGQHGLDIEGDSHSVDADAIRHSKKNHGDVESEALRGQVGIKDEDFEQIPSIVHEPDRVVFGAKTKQGLDAIGYVKRLSDGHVAYVEEVRSGRKHLSAVSMWKYPATADVDRVAANVHPNVRNDGGNGLSIVPGPDAGKNEGGKTRYQGGPGDEGEASKPLENVARVPGTGVRGYMRRMPDGSFEIGKTKIGDFSTLVHETAHMYLDAIRELAQKPGASEQLKADHAKILDFLGAKDGEELTTEQHEKWARANEQYLRDGKAPSAGLRGVFQRFGVWLKSVYARATDLGVEIDPETRGVLDRLYAAEDGVNRAEQESGPRLVTNPDEVGWTEEEFRNYAEARDLEPEQAKVEVLRELNAAAVRERTEKWREEKGNVRDAVGVALDATPEYAAIKALRKGTMEDGTPISLNRDELVKQFGAERVKALRDAHAGMYRIEGGTDAETAAELLGFRSGDEMLRRLTETPRRPAALEQAVRARMTEKYGDIRYDGSLDNKARLALEGQERAKNLHAELAALKRKVAKLQQGAADAKAAMRAITLAPLESYQEAAHEMIEQKALADLQPYRFLVASRKFSREAFDALRKGSIERAVDAKHKELLNHFLFREASAARDYAEKFESYLKRVQSKGIQQRMGLADLNAQQAGGTGDYRDQFNWLLARYKAGPQAQMPDRPLRAWADEAYENGKSPAIAPGILDSNKFADYRSVPLSEVRDLHDALVNIRHLAQQEYEMLVNGKKVEFAEQRNAMVEAIRTNMTERPERILTRNATNTEKAIDALQGGAAAITRMEFSVEKWDGGKTGPWHDFWNSYADAKGEWFALTAEATAKLHEAMEKMPAEMRKKFWTEKVHVDGITEDHTRYDLASMVFNMGNEGNLDRLRKTFDAHGWDRNAIERIPGTLEREHLQYVQDVLNMLQTFGDRMNAHEKEETGLAPVMVKPQPFKVTLADGSEMHLDGGYYPIDYDRRFSLKGYDDDAGKTAQNLMGKGYTRGVLTRGYTKERTGSAGPLNLDFEHVLGAHLDEVCKDLAYRKLVRQGNQLFRDGELRKAVRETAGPKFEQQLIPWLKSIINDGNSSFDQGMSFMNKLVRASRRNFVVAKLCYNSGTFVKQVTHISRLMLFTKQPSFSAALRDFTLSPRETTRMIHEFSPNEMRFRGDNLDRDYREEMQKLGTRKQISKAVLNFGYAPLRYADHVISSSLWLSVYRDKLVENAGIPQEEAHAEAVHQADSAVRMGIGTGTPGDLPPIMRSEEYWKSITTLYGFENVNANIMMLEASKFGRTRNVGRLGYATAMGLLIPGILSPLVVGDRPKDGESWAAWAVRKEALFTMGLIPALQEGGDASQATAFLKLGYKTVGDVRDVLEGTSGKDWADAMIDGLEAAGQGLGWAGTGQVVRTARYTHRANEGKIDNPNVVNAVLGGGAGGKRR